MRLTTQKATPVSSVMGRGQLVSTGSESTAWSKSDEVNVGGPGGSSERGVSVNKGKSEDTETAARKSEGA